MGLKDLESIIHAQKSNQKVYYAAINTIFYRLTRSFRV